MSTAPELVAVRDVAEAEVRDNVIVDDREAAGIARIPFVPSRLS